uniref:Probable cyclin-dependent serine/threonine-protein kinase DDB_G0292550 n=1 Tax=Dermatophagoides pteronyssinus TaxID=6956 RepID=A0A6P6XST4_DERPT|nr:probable cyclin-dependent serine/threonine-protein kinase DDB_G0292550 [Dermatophagoides pteronyssinus]
MDNNHDDNHTDAIHDGNDDSQTTNAATVIGGDGGQIKIDCNTFQPNEDIYYCLVYLILYKNAVLYENIPHCIPTIDKQQQQQQQPNGNFVHLDSFTKSSSAFRDIVGQHRAVSSSSSYPSEIKFNYNSNNNNNNDESKRKKNKRIDQANNNEEESDNEKKQKQIPMHNKNDAKNNNNSSLNEFDSYNRMDEYYYHPTTAAVCIISIDKPEKYLFKLLNIEPSMDWLAENPRLATYFTETIFNNNDNNNSSNLDVSSIDYSHFLVVRNGRLSIDPQINIIENHSQIHYLQSNYLRLEALSSMNLTIKFQKRSYYRRKQRDNHYNNHDNNHDDDYYNDNDDGGSGRHKYHIRQTICDNRQESSSSNRQLDYYDIYEPLTMKIIDATKSITNTFEKSNNHIPFVNERQIVNSDDQDDGSTIQHSSLLQKQPRSPSKLPLLTTSNTLTFGNHNNHSSSFVHSQNLPINQLIIIEQETKQQQQQLQTLPSIKHNHHYIKKEILRLDLDEKKKKKKNLHMLYMEK